MSLGNAIYLADHRYYCCSGDPNAKHLTETERRQIKRRIANRDSARRVRQKKLQTVSELSLQVRPHLPFVVLVSPCMLEVCLQCRCLQSLSHGIHNIAATIGRC